MKIPSKFQTPVPKSNVPPEEKRKVPEKNEKTGNFRENSGKSI